MNKYSVIKEEVVSSNKSKKHKLMDATVRTPDGKEVVWQYVKSRDVVTIVAVDENNRVYCVRQWRPARNDYVWELPAGGIEVENPTEKQVLDEANRELQEEIGLMANSLKILTAFSPSVHMTSTYYVVLATDLEQSELPKDENEELEVKSMNMNEAIEMFFKKQKSTSMSLIGILLAKEYEQI